jgi:butyryl-CoA dehydrogenase
VPAELISRRDVNFLLHEWLDIESLSKRERFAGHDRSSIDAVLDLATDLATDLFAPHNKKADANEPQFVDGKVQLIPEVKVAVDAFSEAGLMAAVFDERYGGLQLPSAVMTACMAYFQAANVGTTGYPFLATANANLILHHGTEQQIDTYARPILEGRFLGTMCLSEPQAGSSLSDVMTRAEAQDDGTYRLFGNKMWISGGDHEISENIVHLVLARAAGSPAGVKGLSLFIVPRFLMNEDGSLGARNDVVLAGLNHKMGYRGTVNTLLNFGEGGYTPDGKPGAVGYLIGELNRGLGCMFFMMNEMRNAVGLAGSALGYTAYLKAVEYARTRPQGRIPGAKDPTRPQVPIIEHTDVRRMLLEQKCYVEGALALNLLVGRLLDEQATAADDEELKRSSYLLEVLTPISKSFPAQWCLQANNLAIQVHGGYGYTREYDVEQHYRDQRLNMIHEGTHGIQSIDLLGRKVVMDDGAALDALGTLMSETISAARSCGDAEFAAFGSQLERTFQSVRDTTTRLHEAPTAELTLANSATYLEVFGHMVIAWIWLSQGMATLGKSTEGKDGDFYAGKRQAMRYFFHVELPRTGPQLALLNTLDSSALDMVDAWF